MPNLSSAVALQPRKHSFRFWNQKFLTQSLRTVPPYKLSKLPVTYITGTFRMGITSCFPDFCLQFTIFKTDTIISPFLPHHYFNTGSCRHYKSCRCTQWKIWSVTFVYDFGGKGIKPFYRGPSGEGWEDNEVRHPQPSQISCFIATGKPFRYDCNVSVLRQH